MTRALPYTQADIERVIMRRSGAVEGDAGGSRRGSGAPHE
jgi:hypothetical protein